MNSRHFVVQPQGADYFRKREAQERSAAERAANTRARSAHEQMAEHYRKLAGDPDGAGPADRKPNAAIRAV